MYSLNQGPSTLTPLVVHSHAFLTELTWQVLTEEKFTFDCAPNDF